MLQEPRLAICSYGQASEGYTRCESTLFQSLDELMRRSWHVGQPVHHCIVSSLLEVPEASIRFLVLLLDIFSCLEELLELFFQRIARNQRHLRAVLLLALRRFQFAAYGSV